MSGAAYCQVTNGGTCVTDGAGNHGNAERCTVQATSALYATATHFNTERCCDHVTIDGTRYSGTTGPVNVAMAAGDTLAWYADGSITRDGFTICATTATTRGFHPTPPSLVTSSLGRPPPSPPSPLAPRTLLAPKLITPLLIVSGGILVVSVTMCMITACLIRKWRDEKARQRRYESTDEEVPESMEEMQKRLEQAQKERDEAEERARKAAAAGGIRLFHQTDRDIAEIILKTQRMKPGSSGLAGGGIYFATTPELTQHKAQRKGVILEATVRLGKIMTLDSDGDSSMSRPKLQRMGGFDSVCIARPVSRGHEYVVYDSKQVLSIERTTARHASS